MPPKQINLSFFKGKQSPGTSRVLIIENMTEIIFFHLRLSFKNVRIHISFNPLMNCTLKDKSKVVSDF